MIQTHRQPAEVIASFCSMAATFCSVGSNRVPVGELSQRWTQAWADGLARADAVRRARPGVPFADVRYAELGARPDRCGHACL